MSIDVWSHFGPDRAPDHLIDVHSLNSTSLLGAFKQLAEIIKHPAPGTVPVVIKEDIQLDEMAKRTSDADFYKMVVKMYGASKARDLEWSDIKRVADENDVLIPAYIRGNKVGRGRWNAEIDSTVDVSAKEVSSEPSSSRQLAVKGAGSSDPIMYIKVTAQDPTSKKFLPTANNPAAQALYQQIQGAIQGPPTEEEVRDPETLYGHMAQLVEMACKGTLRSLLIYGGPGTGKTYTIMQTVS